MSRPAIAIAAELGALLADRPEALRLLQELLSTGRPVDVRADEAADKRREWDRERKKVKRIQDRAAKQTMGSAKKRPPDASTGCPPDESVSHCTLSSFSEAAKEPSRKKGTRLSKASIISAEQNSFAAREGIPDPEIPKVWLEFVDYWSAVPGQRGCKLDWNATWRNRVRQLTPWKTRGIANGNHKPDLASMCFDVADEMRRQTTEDPADGADDPRRGH